MSKTPSKEKLLNLYGYLTDHKIALKLGVSGSTVRRWRRMYSILSKPRGPRDGKRSPITDEDIRSAVPLCYSISEVLRRVGLSEAGSANLYMRKRVENLKISISHFGSVKKHFLGTLGMRMPLEKILVKNSTYRNNQTLKKRLIKEGLLKEICYKCGIGPVWDNEKLMLQLDHIDGDKFNNEIINLRLLCPNCHTQTKTFSGKNKK